MYTCMWEDHWYCQVLTNNHSESFTKAKLKVLQFTCNPLLLLCKISENDLHYYIVQEVDGRDHQLHQLQMECEDIKQEKKQSSITASDMDREINRLKRVICNDIVYYTW